MKVLFDTSVLVAALVQAHPHHQRSVDWLQRALRKEVRFLVAGHTVAELYSVLSRLPVRPRMSPSVVWRLISENVARAAQVVVLSDEDYLSTVEALALRGLAGGVVFDALIARAAAKAEADCLLTWNEADFRRVWPDGEAIIRVP